VWIVQVEFFGTIGSHFGRLEVGPDDDIDIGMPVELVPTEKVGPGHVVFRPVA